MSCLLVGDSHLGSLRQALNATRHSPEDARYAGIAVRAMGRGYLMRSAFFADRGDHAEILDAELRTRVERVPPLDAAYDWIGISGPLNTGRLWRDPAFATFKPFPLHGGTPISVATLRAAVEADVRRSIEFAEVVARSARVFVIESPWPFRANRAVHANGAATVQFVHRWYRDHVLRELERLGIATLEIDPECVDGDGFMKESYHHEKPTDRYHANTAFGRTMLDRVLQRFAGAGVPQAEGRRAGNAAGSSLA